MAEKKYFLIERAGEEVRTIEYIWGFRFHNSIPEYRVKWKEFPMSHSTWKPIHNLRKAYDILKNYNQQYNINIDIHNYVDWTGFSSISPLNNRILRIKIGDILKDDNGEISEAIVTRVYTDKEVSSEEDLLTLMQTYPKLVVDYFEQFVILK